MAIVTAHEPGMVCWTDLMTNDLAGAKTFYSRLFGWQLEETPLPQGETYVMASLGGKSVAAMSKMDPEMSRQGTPPHWNTYFAVTNVEQSALTAERAGGKLIAPPFDVLDVGRMCVVQDPSGAVFSLWQARKHIGAERIGEHGALVWAELQTTDAASCRAFYRALFGFEAKELPTSGSTYTVFQVGEKASCGMMPMPPHVPKGVPSFWGIYFAVEDCDRTVEQATALGARVAMAPTDIPGTGRFACLFDPQGAFFSILHPAPM